MRNIIQRPLPVLMALVLLLLTAMPASAHGCHTGRGSGSGAIAYAYNRVDPGYFTWLDATSKVPVNHVATGSNTHFMQMEQQGGGSGIARIMRVAGTDGLWDRVEFTIRDQNGYTKPLVSGRPTVITVKSDASIRMEIVFDKTPLHRFRFFINGSYITGGSYWPFWEPDQVKLGGNSYNNANQFMGRSSSNAIWTGADVDTTQTGILAFGSASGALWGPTFYENEGYAQISMPILSQLNFRDSYCP